MIFKEFCEIFDWALKLKVMSKYKYEKEFIFY